MMKTLLVGSLVALALVTTAYAKPLPVVSQGDLGTICAQSSGDQNASLKLSNGKTVDVTVHCGGATTTVGAATDTGESEKGPTEAAENGVED